MKFFNARRTAYRTNPRQIDDVIYTTYSYGPLDPPSGAAPVESSPPLGAGPPGGIGRGVLGRGTRRGTASVKWRSSGSDGETTTATTTTAVDTPDAAQGDAGAATYGPPPAPRPGAATGDLLGVPELATTDAATAGATPTKRKGSKWDTAGTDEAEIFLFSYGTVVIWGMTEQQERRFLSSL
jgi:uncharacterized Rmd1/YagE family protein